jgi:hypothetical protein
LSMIGLMNHPHLFNKPAVGKLITTTFVISLHVYHAIPELVLSLISN